jgi:hypothetical protein
MTLRGWWPVCWWRRLKVKRKQTLLGVCSRCNGTTYSLSKVMVDYKNYDLLQQPNRPPTPLYPTFQLAPRFEHFDVALHHCRTNTTPCCDFPPRRGALVFCHIRFDKVVDRLCPWIVHTHPACNKDRTIILLRTAGDVGLNAYNGSHLVV